MSKLEAVVELLKPVMPAVVSLLEEHARMAGSPPGPADRGARLAEFVNSFIEKMVVDPKDQA